MILWMLAFAHAFDGALRFTGEPDRVLLGAIDPGPSFTVELWARFDQPGIDTLICAADADHLNAFCLQRRGGDWIVVINDDDPLEADTCTTEARPHLCHEEALAAGAVRHVALAVSPARVGLWLDGAEVAAVEVDEAVDFTGAEWALGVDAEPTPPPGGFNNDVLRGVIDEVRLWDHVRDPVEMACLRSWGLTGGETGLVALWSLDTVGGGVTPDAAGGHDGLVEGPTLVPSPFGLARSRGGDIGCLDFDLDGFTPDEGDCDDLDPTVFPGAEDVRDDGVDQDCSGSDVTTAVRGGLAACGCQSVPSGGASWWLPLLILAVQFSRRSASGVIGASWSWLRYW